MLRYVPNMTIDQSSPGAASFPTGVPRIRRRTEKKGAENLAWSHRKFARTESEDVDLVTYIYAAKRKGRA